MMNIEDANYLTEGNEIFELISRLYPICRSITGNGVRKTLEIIGESLPNLQIYEIPSQTKVFDWTVPKEWNIEDAYIKNSKGDKIIDFNKSNLHVLNYSLPINKKVTFEELKEHIFSSPEHPDWIPYRTSYYKEDWGFCMSHKQFESLEDEQYEIFIDSSLANGSLTYGELFLKGKKSDEILLTCYICHPSMCNDNLSGLSLLTILAKYLSKMELEYSYRFLFIPETIGAIVWLSENQKNIDKIKFGLIATCLGDKGISTYKKSRSGISIIDKITEQVLIDSKKPFKIIDFFPLGSDERQFSSPGFNIPMGSLMRTMYACFPEYHTSKDNLDFISSEYLADSYQKYWKIITSIEKLPILNDVMDEKIEKENDEKEEIYLNLNPKCEPQLGKRGLYKQVGGWQESSISKDAIFWILNYSDGKNSLKDISKRSGIEYEQVVKNTNRLVEVGLLKKIS